MAADSRTAARLKSLFGTLYDTLVAEAPERAAWSLVDEGALAAAADRARERVGEPGHALGFRTLLKQELDTLCELAPASMSFEASSLPAGRRHAVREARRDARTREGERVAGERRRELRDQAKRLLRDG